jgi:hypothetical protein
MSYEKVVRGEFQGLAKKIHGNLGIERIDLEIGKKLTGVVGEDEYDLVVYMVINDNYSYSFPMFRGLRGDREDPALHCREMFRHGLIGYAESTLKTLDI